MSRKRGAAPALLLLIRVPGSSGPFSAADRCAGHCCARHSHSPHLQESINDRQIYCRGTRYVGVSILRRSARAYGRGMAGNAKWVIGVWLIVLVALGAAAPSVFSSLAGAGWQANGSESVQVRELAQEHFGGNSSAAVQVVVHSDDHTVDSPEVQRTLTAVADVFAGDTRFGAIIAPQPGMSISPDGHTGILIAGANASTDEMVKASTISRGS